MKPCNFPARRLQRKQEALFRNGIRVNTDCEEDFKMLQIARQIKTKKDRSK